MKIISARLHGIIDYVVVVFLWLAPFVFNLCGLVSTALFLSGAIHLALTVFTNYQYGVFKVIPIRVHSGIEFFVGIVLILSPSVLGGIPGVDSIFDQFVLGGFGLAVLVVWALTDYNEESNFVR